MPVLAGSERTPDKFCNYSPQKTESTECSGVCMSINVTGEYEGKPAFFGKYFGTV